MTTSKRLWIRFAAWTMLAFASAAAFVAYLRPDFVIDLAGRMFLCN